MLLNTPQAKAALWSFGPGQFGTIPFISPPWLRLVDCYGGLALVAVSEELVFRGALPAIMQRIGASPVAAWLMSSALFGLAHWSFGPGLAVQTAVIGAVFGLMVQFSRSLGPVIIAHFLVDFVEFYGTPS
jgi:membrane protease YdiL (CAAX protease family)